MESSKKRKRERMTSQWQAGGITNIATGRCRYARSARLIRPAAVLLGLAILSVAGALVSVRASEPTISDDGGVAHDDGLKGDTMAESRIIGGKDAEYQRYRYLAHIYNRHGRPYCAGTLITPDTILSAAHCADDDSVPSYVIIGKHSRLSYQNEFGVEKIAVSKIILHPDHRDGFDWINDHIMNDIVLLKLNARSRHMPVKVNFNMKLPNSGSAKRLRVIGWGTTSYERTRPDNLQFVDVDFIPNAVCSQSRGKVRPTSTYERSYKGYITNDMMCAASPGKDACR